MKNFDSYRFRASQLGKLVSPTKGKSNLEQYNAIVVDIKEREKKIANSNPGKRQDGHIQKVKELEVLRAELEPIKDEVELSTTAISLLQEIFIAEKYGRTKEFYSKYTEKGNYAEEDSLSLVTDVHKELYIKNKEQFSNEWVAGTPDLVLERSIIDIKTKWDIWGFMKEDGTSSEYYWQLQTYMWLTGKEKAELIYTLVDTPQHLIFSEFSKAMYMSGVEDGSEEMMQMEEQIEKNLTYSDIDKKERMKVFKFEFDKDAIESAKRYVVQGRKYLNELTLN